MRSLSRGEAAPRPSPGASRRAGPALGQPRDGLGLQPVGAVDHRSGKLARADEPVGGLVVDTQLPCGGPQVDRLG